TTAKGSTYEVAQDGTTIRNKAERAEHPGDFGPQPKSERTFYVTPGDAIKLGEIQTSGGGQRSVAISPDGRAGIRYEDGASKGKIERRSVVPISDRPEVGKIPVELWDGGRRVHFGNE